MSHPRCVYINNRCRYQSITQQRLKRCLIKDNNNYMFRPTAVIIRFSSESITNITDIEISPSWHNHTNPIKHYYHTFGWKPDAGRILSSFIKHLFRYCFVIDWYLHLLFTDPWPHRMNFLYIKYPYNHFIRVTFSVFFGRSVCRKKIVGKCFPLFYLHPSLPPSDRPYISSWNKFTHIWFKFEGDDTCTGYLFCMVHQVKRFFASKPRVSYLTLAL